MGNKQKNDRNFSQSPIDNTDKKETPKINQTVLINIKNFANEHQFSYITIVTIVITILVSIVTTFGLSFVHNVSEQKQIAQGISNEINQLYPNIQQISTSYINYQQNRVLLPLPTYQIYTNDGLYYLYGKDLNKLNPKLSSKLYDFYRNITQAENLRSKLYDECFDIKGDPDIVICNLTYYNMNRITIYEKILHATNDIESIRPLLNESINNPYALF